MPCCASTGSICSVGRGGAMLSALLLVGGSSPSPSPSRLAIYYGYPSLVNGAQGELALAVSQFSEYDLLVLGDGLEFDQSTSGHAGPEEHAFTARLIRQLRLAPRRRPDVYGYVDLGRTQHLTASELTDRIDRWSRMGVQGVFLDEAGYDFGVTRERQNAAVTAAHARGLRACLNGFQPGDILETSVTPLNAVGGGNPRGLPPVVSARDAVLLEAFAAREGVPEPHAALTARTQAALHGRKQFGTRVFAVATSGPGDDATLAKYGWWTAAAFGIDAYGWSMPQYSAVSSRLPWVPRPEAEATLARAAFIGDLAVRPTGWSRPTTAGTIHVDAAGVRGYLDLR